MSWTEDQINKLRDRMSLAKRAGEWLSVHDARLVLGLIAFWRRMTVSSSFMDPAEGMIPTIGHMKSQGIAGIIVECGQSTCGNRRKLSFDDLGLSDRVVFIEIAKHRGFRCTRCGSRKVTIVANHPNPLGSGWVDGEAGKAATP